MTGMRSVHLLTAAALALTLASPAYAQQSTSTITGRVVDASGGALPGVGVALASAQMIGGARTAVTDVQGVYRFTLLPAGTYTVSFTLSGFSTLNVEGVVLSGGATMTINGELKLAALQETVTVTSMSPTIDLESANRVRGDLERDGGARGARRHGDGRRAGSERRETPIGLDPHHARIARGPAQVVIAAVAIRGEHLGRQLQPLAREQP